jgi:hypothetical protein
MLLHMILSITARTSADIVFGVVWHAYHSRPPLLSAGPGHLSWCFPLPFPFSFSVSLCLCLLLLLLRCFRLSLRSLSSCCTPELLLLYSPWPSPPRGTSDGAAGLPTHALPRLPPQSCVLFSLARSHCRWTFTSLSGHTVHLAREVNREIGLDQICSDIVDCCSRPAIISLFLCPLDPSRS